ncbi:MAG: M48 family metallopeptidase [Candidatus Binatia bacterium]
MKRACASLALLSLLSLLAACVAPPTRGRVPAPAARLSPNDEYANEEARLRGLAEQRHEDHRVRVERVARRLLSTMKDPPEVQFVVIPGDPNVNAGATFGQIGVTAGLLDFVEDDDELAVVLSHELAHITEGHVTKGVIGGVALTVLAVLADTQLPGAGQAVGGVGQLFLNRFTQGQERNADDVGLRLAYAAGYDPRAAATVQERLAVEVPQTMAAGYFNTHPSSVERAMTAKKLASELLAAGPPPGREGVLAEMRVAERRARRPPPAPGDVGYRSERALPDDEDEDGGYAIGGSGERRRADDERAERRHASRADEPAVETTSDDCARARVYRDMAADADDPTEREALRRRAQRVCPE